MLRASGSRTSVRWLLYLAVFVLTAGFRYLTLSNGFPNDHFVYISGGWQMLAGGWPTRDWVDPGLPLMFLASAGAQAIFGETLFAEAVLVSVSFGLAASLTLAAVLEMTGSPLVALLAAVLEVVVFPRTYGYPKMLVYALGFLCFARYINRPGRARIIAMAAAVVIAFLFRHDHGIFLGVGGALTILFAPEPKALRERAWHAGMFVSAGFAMVLPYVVYVQMYGGLADYVRAGLEFSRREAERQWHVWPAVFGDPDPLSSALVYEFYVVPVIAVVALAALRDNARVRRHRAFVVPAAIVALAVNYNFVRDPLVTRLPDAAVPALILGAWLVWCAFRAARQKTVAIVAAVAGTVVFSASLAAAGDIYNNVERSDVVSEWNHLPERFAERTRALRARFSPRLIPTPATASLIPFFTYLDRCTTRDHRLLVGGYLVELPFYARRMFAAGQGYFGGSFGGADASDVAVRRLQEQVVPFVVMPSDYTGDFRANFPSMDAFVRSRYRPLTDVHVSDDLDINILVDTAITPAATDPQTGWPCFK